MKLFLIACLILIMHLVHNVNSQPNNQQATSKRPQMYGYLYNRQFTTRHRTLKNHRQDQLFFGEISEQHLIQLIQNSFLNINYIYKGFFPIWSAILVGVTGVCLFISLLAISCYLAGCRNPHKRLMLKKDDSILRQEFELPMSNDDYVSMSMIESMEKQSNKLFSDSRLISEYDYELNSKIYDKMKKKRFLKDNL